MLYALTSGERIQAQKTTDKSMKFCCPSGKCKNPELILKAGPEKVAHFAHKVADAECNRYSERETNVHTAMKRVFQEGLSIPSHHVEYREIDGVQPDLIWWISETDKYAIEVQHSPISIVEIERRNSIYCKNGFIPVWIFNRDTVGCDYYEKGKYGLWDENCLLRLKTNERYLLKIQGFLIYIAFNNDFYEENEEEGKLFCIASNKGPLFEIMKTRRFRACKTLFEEDSKLIKVKEELFEILRLLKPEKFLLSSEKFIEDEKNEIEELKWHLR
ncbi:MAG: hypothetical protein HeimC3_26550 [Candidatus Heimdallarchaeota archaeon LC_3]|nr:MAG: hypothetical protein HeimC3_26550 [Candidatus Heimdallarchaeota archaeon LC_3]